MSNKGLAIEDVASILGISLAYSHKLLSIQRCTRKGITQAWRKQKEPFDVYLMLEISVMPQRQQMFEWKILYKS
jgi:hypothetical protein